ncbi:MAG: hypothetical protein D6710_12460 [Nitrospirae bacterium]|nr:MAG: hypothetical protein D6710_12460 [Nitrospirota bacterium]
MVTFEYFEEQLKKSLPERYRDLRIEWAFTSEIVRERANEKFRKAGINRRFRSLAQVVSDLEDEGYRKIFIQPLHIFPGIEYRHLKEMVEGLEKTFREFHLTLRVGYPLLAHWEWVEEAIEALEPDLLKENEGCNVLSAHGTWDTSDGANITYLGLERLLKERYSNVSLGAIEGIPTRKMALDEAKRCGKKRVRFIPFMFVAGDHIMNDIMGKEPSEDGELSWALELKREGFQVEALKINYKGVELYKSLGLNERVNELFIRNILKGLKGIR